MSRLDASAGLALGVSAAAATAPVAHADAAGPWSFSVITKIYPTAQDIGRTVDYAQAPDGSVPVRGLANYATVFTESENGRTVAFTSLDIPPGNAPITTWVGTFDRSNGTFGPRLLSGLSSQKHDIQQHAALSPDGTTFRWLDLDTGGAAVLHTIPVQDPAAATSLTEPDGVAVLPTLPDGSGVTQDAAGDVVSELPDGTGVKVLLRPEGTSLSVAAVAGTAGKALVASLHGSTADTAQHTTYGLLDLATGDYQQWYDDTSGPQLAGGPLVQLTPDGATAYVVEFVKDASGALRTQLAMLSSSGLSPASSAATAAVGGLAVGGTVGGLPATPTKDQVRLELRRLTSQVRYGTAVTVTGRDLSPDGGHGGDRVLLEAKPYGAAGFTAVASTTSTVHQPGTSTPSGALSATYTPSRRTQVRWHLVGTSTVEEAFSPAGVVTVQPALTEGFSSSTVRRSGSLAVTGRLAPSFPNEIVTVQRQSGTSWVTVVRTRTTSTSSYRVDMHSPATAGTYTYRAIVAATPAHAAAVSLNHRLSVTS